MQMGYQNLNLTSVEEAMHIRILTKYTGLCVWYNIT